MTIGPAVRIRNVRKTYEGGVEALRGVSLELASGEITALVGRSGCGKTTLLNLCGAMDFPTSGEVEVSLRLSEEPCGKLSPGMYWYCAVRSMPTR